MFSRRSVGLRALIALSLVAMSLPLMSISAQAEDVNRGAAISALVDRLMQASGIEQTPNDGAVFTIVGENNPATDPTNVQAAVNQAFLAVGGTVQLIGTFDFGACSLCVIVPGPMTISGTGDPSLTDQSIAPTTIVKSTSLASTAASLTPRIGGESTRTRSKRCLTSESSSAIRREFKIPAASAGRIPDGRK